MGFPSFRNRHQGDNAAPRRPNWVKKPGLLSQDVQPAITDVLELCLRQPLEDVWHSTQVPLRERATEVLNTLPASHRVWKARLVEDYVASLPLLFKPGLVGRLAGQIHGVVDGWARRERGGSETRRCRGRAYHPRVVFFNITISILERVCERCEKEHPPGVDYWDPVPPLPVSPQHDDDDDDDGLDHHDQDGEDGIANINDNDNDKKTALSRLRLLARAAARDRRPRLGPIELPPRKLLWVHAGSPALPTRRPAFRYDGGESPAANLRRLAACSRDRVAARFGGGSGSGGRGRNGDGDGDDDDHHGRDRSSSSSGSGSGMSFHPGRSPSPDPDADADIAPARSAYPGGYCSGRSGNPNALCRVAAWRH